MIRSSSALFIIFLIVSLNVISLSNEFSFKKERFNKNQNNVSIKDYEIDKGTHNEIEDNQDTNQNDEKE